MPRAEIGGLLAQYGYAFVFAGALAEGESVLLLAGFAAHRGLLKLPVLGYQFGNALQWLLVDLRSVEEGVFGAALLAAVAWALWRHLRHA